MGLPRERNGALDTHYAELAREVHSTHEEAGSTGPAYT